MHKYNPLQGYQVSLKNVDTTPLRDKSPYQYQSDYYDAKNHPKVNKNFSIRSNHHE